jgi:phage terminase large subunit-like protein
MEFPAYITRAIKSGPIPEVRNWRELKVSELTRGELVCRFIETYLKIPEGAHVSQPIRLLLFQEIFILAIYDNPHITRKAILSIARKNGKTALIAALLLAHLVGPESKKNSQLVSGAQSRDQASLVYKLAAKMVVQSPDLYGIVKDTPSRKALQGLLMGTEYHALAAEGSRAQGLSPVFAILDETGQVVGPNSSFVEAIETSQGAHETPLIVYISTQAPSDADMLSLLIDDAERSGDPHTVCHVYAADDNCDLMDEEQWQFANPALGVFRSRKDLEEQLKQADRLSTKEAAARNLLLNNRIALEKLWISPKIWKANGNQPDIGVFQRYGAACGLDLSARIDLTAAVLAAKDDFGNVHLLPYIYTPLEGIEERARVDRAPYDMWVKQGLMFALPGRSVDYEQMFAHLRAELDRLNIVLNSIEYDRWRIDIARGHADAVGFGQTAEWNSVGQGYKDFSPRCEHFENLLIDHKICHGNHPLLTLAASNAIAVSDAAGSIKLDKSKTTQRIDPLVAAVMAAFKSGDTFNVLSLVG